MEEANSVYVDVAVSAEDILYTHLRLLGYELWDTYKDYKVPLQLDIFKK